MTKTVLKKRPELIQLPSVPTILKLSEIPSGTYVMKINVPFNLTHLAKSGVEKCFFVSATRKSLQTVFGKESAEINELRKRVLQQIRDYYPLLAKHVYINVDIPIRFGSKGYQDDPPSYYYASNLPKLVAQLDDCGFSSLPLTAFMVPIDTPQMWINFTRRKEVEGFIASQFGNKMYSECTLEELEELTKQNPILQSLKVYICETAVATGKWITCRLPPKEVSE